MNERQESSLAGRRGPAPRAVLRACALALALAGCGQKGPLYLPAQAGPAAKPAASAASATRVLPPLAP